MTTLVSIAQGGTGANNAADARSNLGAAPSAAYDQANSAYTQANSAFSAANNAQVTVYQNSASSITTQRINFVNTATITVSISNDSGNANVALTAVGGAAYDQANAAYSAANGAYAQANGAYLQANGAYAQANGAYGQANIAYGQANAAYGQANAGYAQANAAYGQANLAYAAANNSNLKLGGLVTGTLNVTQDLIVGGNIYLEGNTTFINVATYSVEDPLIFLASNNTLTDSVDIGFIGGKNTSGTFSHTGLARDATDGKYKLFDGLPDNDHIGNVVNFANSYLATLVANVEANSITLVGNTVATQANLTLAHDSANGAYTQANGAYAQANGAYAQANGAYGQANGAYASANGAYAQANGAYAQANSAANTVRVSANGASTLVNKSLNFINTSSVLVTVNDNLDGNANISFTTLSGANSVSSTFTANGVSNTYTMSAFAADANNVLVTIDGILLTPGTEYTVNGTTLTILYVPANGSKVEVRTITGGGDGGSASLGFVRTSFVGNGSEVNFTLTDAPVNEDNCLVFVDRILQRNSEYNVSTTTLTFTAAPDNGAVIDTFVTQYLASNAAVIKSGDTMTGNLTLSGATLNTAIANISTIVTGNALTISTGTGSNANIIFSANNAEDMRILANGDIGVGTTAPTAKFEIFNGSNTAYYGVYGRDSQAYFGQDSVGLAFYQAANSPLYFSTNALERMRITNDGNVGLGTTNPDAIGHGGTNRFFNIYNSGTAINSQAHIILMSNASSQALSSIGSISWGLPNASATNKGVALIAAVTGTSSTSANPSAYMTFFTRNTTESAWAERMRINEAGNVGIGTTNPFENLTIYGNTNSRLKTRIVNDNSGSSARSEFVVNAFGNSWGLGIGAAANNSNAFYINEDSNAADTTRFTIRTGGNVGIGTTNPTGRLHIWQSGAATSLNIDGIENPIFASRYVNSADGAVVFLAKSRNATVGSHTIVQDGDELGTIKARGSNGTAFADAAGIFFHVDGTPGAGSDMPGRIVFGTSADNTTSILERMRIDSAGRLNVARFGYQPRFLASRAGDYTGYNATSTGDAVVIYNNSVDNIGSHFNTSTGKFTAPVAGMYMFQASAFSSATFVQGWFVVNGSRQNWSDTVVSSTGSQLFTCSGFFYLNANDSIGFHPYNGSDSNATIYGNAYHTWFKGYLIG